MAFPVRPRLADAPAASSTPAGAAAVAQPVHDGVRRLQIGVSGVIMVLLLVGLASVATDRAQNVVASNMEAGQDIVPPVITNSAPLEELGVQPVAKDASVNSSSVSTAILPPDVAVQPRATVPDLEPDPELARARQAKN